METELDNMQSFIRDTITSMPESIPEMQTTLDLCIGYHQRAGELCNRAEMAYHQQYSKVLDEMTVKEDWTEEMRKAHIKGRTAQALFVLKEYKTILGTLRSLQMRLFQSIKTRRGELESQR
jgi:hypothetical protein